MEKGDVNIEIEVEKIGEEIGYVEVGARRRR